MNSFDNCRDMEINVFRSQLLKGFHFKSLRKISINFMIIFFFAERVWGVRRMVYVHVEYTTIFFFVSRTNIESKMEVGDICSCRNYNKSTTKTWRKQYSFNPGKILSRVTRTRLIITQYTRTCVQFCMSDNNYEKKTH